MGTTEIAFYHEIQKGDGVAEFSPISIIVPPHVPLVNHSLMNHHSHILEHQTRTPYGYHENVRVDHGRSWSGRHFMDQLEPKGFVGRRSSSKNGSRACEILRTETYQNAPQLKSLMTAKRSVFIMVWSKTRVQKCVQEDNQWMIQVSTYYVDDRRPLQNRHSLFRQIRDPRLDDGCAKRNLLECRKTPCGEYALSDHWPLSWRSSTGEFLFFQRQRDR